jgi:valyl-tRNA synthetase
VTLALEEYRLNDAATQLYQFVWNDFCDWYLELVKSRLMNADDPTAATARGVLTLVLKDTLALLHPFMPYLTEVLWQAVQEKLEENGAMLMNSDWPTFEDTHVDWEAHEDMAVIQTLVRAVRNVRSLTMVGERKPLHALVVAPQPFERGVLEQHGASAKALAFLETMDVRESASRPAASAVGVAGGVEVFVQLGAEVDLTNLKDVLEKRLVKQKQACESLDKKLSNASFVERAAPDVVRGEGERRDELQLEIDLLARNLAGL